jgi:hypothetical protein
MAVYYAGGGGGLFDSLLGGLGMASMFVPGMQGVAPYLMGAKALAKGDVGGAIGSVAAPMIGKEISGIFNKTATPANAPLDNALMNAQRQNFQLPDIAALAPQMQTNESMFDALTKFNPQTAFQRRWR